MRASVFEPFPPTERKMANATEEAEKILEDFIKLNIEPSPNWQRTTCCYSSRYLYCPICCRLLIPKEDWPDVLREGNLQLPFRVHILLDDRPASSTGVQVMTILKAIDDQEEEVTTTRTTNDDDIERRAALYDFDKDEIPPYENVELYSGTYLLFPTKDSVPLSSVVRDSKIMTLVVLDCKWSHSRLRFHPSVQTLPKVHLDTPPQQSHYWRWHNAGPGMLSSVEALYFAAWQVTDSLGWTLEEKKRLIHLLWIFGLQRTVIVRRYAKGDDFGCTPHLPFTEEAKEFRRKLRDNCRKERSDAENEENTISN
jgi:hypothetical protein